MKKSLLIVPLLGMSLASCQSDDLEPAVVGQGDGNVTFHLSAPEAMEYSRAITAANSALGGISNVDWANYDLRYKLAVYQVNETESGTTTRLVIPAQTVTVDTYSDVDFSLRLTPNRKYTFVVWADFVTQGSQADLHYDTSNLENITCKDDNDKMLNDESRDAYFVTETIEVGPEGLSQSLTLRRPFAKLRVISTDWAIGDLDLPNEFDVTYYGCQRFEGLNARTGETITTTDLAADCATAYHATIVKDTKEYSLGYDSSDRNRTLVVDYLVAQPTQSTIHMKFAPNEGLPELNFSTDVPIRRNWLTTILGDLLTTGANIHILCDEGFTDEYNGFHSSGSFNPVKPFVDSEGVYHIKTADELAWLSVKENISTLNQATVVLDSDIDLKGVNWAPINAVQKVQVTQANGTTKNETHFCINDFNGQGHTIYNLAITGNKTAEHPYGEDQYMGLFSTASKITIQNLNMENVSINNNSGHAGAIAGHLGGNGGVLVKNCSVKNVFIRQLFYDEDRSYSTWNAGAIAGIINGGDLEGCHAENVCIQTGWRAGGLVGFISGYDFSGRSYYIKNCSVKNAILWNTFRFLGCDGYQLHQIGSLIGCISGHNIKTYFSNCSQEGCTYAFGGHASSSSNGWVTSNNLQTWENDIHNMHDLYLLYSGQEASRGTYNITFADGSTVPYGPINKFFGIADDSDEEVYIDNVLIEDHL